MPTDPSTESKVAEAAHAAAVAHEANSNAREAQMHETLVKALREVLVDGNDEERPMLIKRIPFICSDIIAMKTDISLIKKFGGYILLGIGSLFLTLVGALLLRAI